MLDPVPKREKILNEWRARLRKADEVWRLADQRYLNILDCGIPALLSEARRDREAAKSEFARALTTFTALALHGKFPDDETL